MPTRRISAYEANRLLDHAFSEGAWIEPRDDDPGEDGSGGVIVGVSRVFVPAAGWTDAVAKELHNVDPIVFTNMPACVIDHVAAFDAEEGGNFKGSCPRLDDDDELDPLTVLGGQTITIPAEACSFTLENIEV